MTKQHLMMVTQEKLIQEMEKLMYGHLTAKER